MFARDAERLADVRRRVNRLPLGAAALAGTTYPLAAILSMALMLRYSFDQHDTAARVEAAVRRVLAEGYRTGDIAEPGCRRVGTSGMGDAVVRALGAN